MRFLDSKVIKVFFNPKIGENIALSAARSTAVLISAMLVHSTSFFESSSDIKWCVL